MNQGARGARLIGFGQVTQSITAITATQSITAITAFKEIAAFTAITSLVGRAVASFECRLRFTACPRFD